MATFWERAAHSVYRMFSCILTYCNFSYFPRWFFRGGGDFGSECIISRSLLIFYSKKNPFIFFFILNAQIRVIIFL